jgi:DNA adenine methylase
MQYQGSKKQLAKYILPIILKDRQEGQWYVEPFCGGCNTLSEVTGNRIGADSNQALINMWREVAKGWLPPKFVDEQEYLTLKTKNDIDNPLTAYAFCVYSYRNIYRNGYDKSISFDKRNGKWYDQATGAWKNNYKQFPKLRDVTFLCRSYDELKIPNASIIYCDPPYANTFGYQTKFNSEWFWNWVRFMVAAGHKVFISEYVAPDDFTCVWEKELRETNFAKGKKHIEKLFVHRSQV